ncbi:transcriptional regulator, MarR family [[Clostridium] scindens ATCC 35704]|jgi:DNA-binding MarR family transcriptional regulator|nr:MarR family transcriptional regulator [[Clostridium] scindens]EDS05923.1 transcriptional regulator, MarR family [[Clostridium] scindens ATCC 35704]
MVQNRTKYGGEKMLFDLWDGLSLFKKIYDQSLEPVCKKYQLTRMELDILLFLANNPGYDTAKDIIERRRLTKSHVSMSLKDLERRDLVQKEYYPGNQKTAHLKLSSASIQMVAEGQQAQKKFFQTVFRDFNPEDVSRMEDYFERMRKNMQNALKEEL